MGKDSTSLPEDHSEWLTFFCRERLPTIEDPDPEGRGGEGRGFGHLAALHVLGYRLVRWGRYSAQQQQGVGAGVGARTYALQLILLSVPHSFPSGPRMHDSCDDDEPCGY